MRYYRRFCVHGRSLSYLTSSVLLRSAHKDEPQHAGALVLDEVWTHRSARGQGYATALLKMAQEEARRLRRAVLCRPHAHDAGMRQGALEQWYERLGWRPAYAALEWGWYLWQPEEREAYGDEALSA